MDPVGAHCGCGRWYAALTAAGTGLFWLFVHAITGIEWLLIPFTASFAAQLTLFGVSRIGLQPDRGPRSLLVLGYTGLGWALTYVPVLLIAFGGVEPGATGPGVPGLLGDLGLGLSALGLVAAVFYLLMPRLYGPPVRTAAINPTFAALASLASLVAALRWLIYWPLRDGRPPGGRRAPRPSSRGARVRTTEAASGGSRLSPP